MTMNSSGCLVDGLSQGLNGVVGSPTAVLDKVMTCMGNPHEKLTSVAGSQLCADIDTQPIEFYMSDTGDSGSSWIHLISGA